MSQMNGGEGSLPARFNSKKISRKIRNMEKSRYQGYHFAIFISKETLLNFKTLLTFMSFDLEVIEDLKQYLAFWTPGTQYYPYYIRIIHEGKDKDNTIRIISLYKDKDNNYPVHRVILSRIKKYKFVMLISTTIEVNDELEHVRNTSARHILNTIW